MRYLFSDKRVLLVASDEPVMGRFLETFKSKGHLIGVKTSPETRIRSIEGQYGPALCGWSSFVENADEACKELKNYRYGCAIWRCL